MRVVLQRSREAKVEVDGEIVGAIEKGFVLLVGITHSDTLEEAKYLADKIAHLRVFEDENGKMNQSILDREEPFYRFPSLPYMEIHVKEEDLTLWMPLNQSRQRCYMINSINFYAAMV